MRALWRVGVEEPEGAFEPSDEELLERIAAGEERAFGRLMERYGRQVHRFVLWYGELGEPSAEELTQEVFARLLRAAAGFRGDSSFRTWLFSLARNVCREHCRRRATRRRFEAPRTTLEDAARSLPDVSLGPLERLCRAELAAAVRAAVGTLRPHHRVALLLREWQELSYREMATVLEVPEGTVRSRLHNARAALAARLAELVGDER